MKILVGTLDDTMIDGFNQMPALQARLGGRWTRFRKATHNNPYCGPFRWSRDSGRTSLSSGVINHGFNEASTIKAAVDAGMAQYMLGPMLRSKGWLTAWTGKTYNDLPWDKGDSFLLPGFDLGGYYGQLDDSSLGGVHATHQPNYLGYALTNTGLPGTPTAYATINKGSTDSWTTTGTNATGRTSSGTDYFTDYSRILMENCFTAAGSRSLFFNMSERATHGSIVVANRHSATPTGGLTPFTIAAATVHQRANFNPPDSADWSTRTAWIRSHPFITDSTVIDAFKTDQRTQWRAVQSVDEKIRDFYNFLVANSMLDDTVQIWMSDNGWLRGEHRIDKKNLPYHASIANEIWVRHPGASLTNRDSDALIQNIDIAPTICEIAGVRPARHMNGQSFLSNILTGSDTGWRDTAFIESYNVDARGVPAWKGVVTSTAKYIEWEAYDIYPAEQELFDLTDVDSLDGYPKENRNVINDSAYASLKIDMQDRLARLKVSMAA